MCVCTHSSWGLNYRGLPTVQVILATNIAESSITVPDIKYGTSIHTHHQIRVNNIINVYMCQYVRTMPRLFYSLSQWLMVRLYTPHRVLQSIISMYVSICDHAYSSILSG